MKTHASPAFLVLVALLFQAVPAATLTLVPATQFQTIDGFGAHGGRDVWWSNGPFYDDNFLNLLLDDLGMTIFRNEYYPPNETDKPGKQAPYIRAVKDAAARKGIPVKFMATYWTPPPEMKDCNCPFGGSLKPSSYNAFVDYCVSTVNWYKNQAGADLYCLSIQNEPQFSEPYNSCVYTAQTYHDVFKLVGAKFRSLGLKTKLIGPEDMASLAEASTFITPVLNDTAARKYLDIFAVHGYGSDGRTPGNAGNWGGLGRVRTNFKLVMWQTETSGYPMSWDGAMSLAQTILMALRFGGISGWVFWQINEFPGSAYTLMAAAQPTERYYASKQFYRYVRPGAVRIQCDCDDKTIDNVAFVHAGEKTMSVVLMNVNADARTVSLAGSGIPQSFTLYRSSGGENCANKGTVSASNIQLPARSISTLVASNYTPPASGVGAPAAVARTPWPSPASRTVAVYTLDGRQIGRFVSSAADHTAPVANFVVAGDGRSAVVHASVTRGNR